MLELFTTSHSHNRHQNKDVHADNARKHNDNNQHKHNKRHVYMLMFHLTPRQKRVRWKITDNMDRKLFQTHISSSQGVVIGQVTIPHIHLRKHKSIHVGSNSWMLLLRRTTFVSAPSPHSQIAKSGGNLHHTYTHYTGISPSAQCQSCCSSPWSCPPPSPDVLAFTRRAYIKARGEFLSAVRKGKSKYWDSMVSATDQQTQTILGSTQASHAQSP